MATNQSSQTPIISTPTLMCLVVANMIGAGVFTTSGFALGALGSADRVLWVWLVAGVIAILGAICYGGLSRQLVRSGGEYLFLSEAVHPLVGFMAGWISLLAGFTGAIAFSATTLVQYLPAEWGILTNRESPLIDHRQIMIACGAIAIAAVPHLLNTAPGAIWQNTMVIFKLFALVCLIAYGFIALTGSETAAPGVEAALPQIAPTTWATQLMWVSFSFAGFNAAIYIAGEAKLGETTVRRSMLYATIGVTIIYLALNALFVYSAPVSELAGKPDIAAVAATYLGGENLGQIVRLLVALSLFTSVSAMLQAGPRVYVKMAEDGLLPQWLIPTDGVPRTAILLQAYLATLLVCAATVQDLLNYVSFLLSVSSAATVICLLLPRFRGTSGNRPVVLWPVLPILFASATLVIATMGLVLRYRDSPFSLGLSLLVVASGGIVYFVLKNRAR